jgi:hypothetical protein
LAKSFIDNFDPCKVWYMVNYVGIINRSSHTVFRSKFLNVTLTLYFWHLRFIASSV